MRGMGTIVNVLAVIVGSGIGLGLRNGLPERLRTILTQACGLSVVFIGIAGAMAGMLSVADGALGTEGSILLVLSLVLGGLCGELLEIERRLDAMGEKLQKRFATGDDSNFVVGFVTASLVICVGAMAVVGSIKDGLEGDGSMLFAKSILDFVIVMVFSSTFGLGVMFSAVPLGIYQGGITLCAVFIEPYLTDAMISGMSFVGSVLICAVGLNLLRPGLVKVGNMLPALFVPVVWELIRPLFERFM